VWSIVDKVPAGATLHYVDEGVDTGDIVAQVETPVYPWDTGKSLYERLEQESLALLQREWPRLEAGTATRSKQQGSSTVHRVKDLARIDELDLDAEVRVGDLLDVLRARTFPPYKGAFFRAGGKKIHVGITLEVEDE
jgi:methionyl-tRNA formyltransferase